VVTDISSQIPRTCVAETGPTLGTVIRQSGRRTAYLHPTTPSMSSTAAEERWGRTKPRRLTHRCQPSPPCAIPYVLSFLHILFPLLVCSSLQPPPSHAPARTASTAMALKKQKSLLHSAAALSWIGELPWRFPRPCGTCDADTLRQTYTPRAEVSLTTMRHHECGRR
jgi:hypothetical protein